MFPTRGTRDKIPRSLFYPLKAKFLSDALADVPQACALGLYFSSYPSSAKLLKQTSHRFFQVEYSCYQPSRFSPRLLETSEFYSPRWNIWIYPVPVAVSPRVVELFEAVALPKIRAWLHEKAEVANLRSCRYTVSYDGVADELRNSTHDSL